MGRINHSKIPEETPGEYTHTIEPNLHLFHVKHSIEALAQIMGGLPMFHVKHYIRLSPLCLGGRSRNFMQRVCTTCQGNEHVIPFRRSPSPHFHPAITK